MATKHIVPKDWDDDITALTPTQRLFLFYYAQKPSIEWACEQASCSPLTVKKKWKYDPTFARAWGMIIRGEVTDVIKAAAKDQAGQSFARIVELRDQDSNPRVALDAAKACLRAIEDPTFASRVQVTKDIGSNWARVLSQLLPEIKGLAQGDIVDAEDWWEVIEEGEPALLEDGSGDEEEYESAIQE